MCATREKMMSELAECSRVGNKLTRDYYAAHGALKLKYCCLIN